MTFTDIKTGLGYIRGEDMGDYQVFRSIAYAEPPIGDLRWKRPVKKAPWEGILDATCFKTRAVQILPQEYGGPDGFYCKEFYNNYDFIPQRSEDCLHLSVWTPKAEPGQKLPVAFWIHGGGFGSGFGFEKEFDGAAYARRGVILVTINYRVGIMGFLTHPWLAQEDPDGLCGNYGIFDQMMALEWVHEHIESFGGDPENITIFGQSAGSGSVQTLVSTPLSGTIVKRAILQSGIMADRMRSYSMEESMEANKDYVRRTGAQDLQELRAMSWQDLMAVYVSYMREAGIDRVRLAPVADGYLLDASLSDLMESGRVRPIPYIVGCNRDDIFKEEGQDHSPLYENCEQWCAVAKQYDHPDVYMYYFTHDLPGDDAGSFHSAELWYTFGTLGRCWRPMTGKDYVLSGRMLDYWTSFMKTGVPGLCDGERWDVWPAVKVFE